MSEAKENPCPDCGEMVRVNSLRCWNCGAFMNPELEEKYLEMQSKPQETIYSSLPQDEVASLPDAADEDDDDGDDFELSMPTTKPVVNESATESDSLPVDINKLAEEKSDSSTEKTTSKPAPSNEGDDLFNIAMKEEKKQQKERRKRAQRGGLKTPGGGLIIFCPYGCRMVVKESHRGMQGKCPECKAPFIVPVDPPDFSKKKEKKAGEGETAATEEVKSAWLLDLHLHTVNPEKLKLKADSLLKDFTQADFGFVNDQLVITVFNKKERGQLGKKEDPREAVKQQLAAGKKVSDLEVSEKYSFTKEQAANLKVVQPTESRADSIFHGITVFGEGRIAIQLPGVEDKNEILYVSMGITQFWEFKTQAEEVLGVTGLGENSGIPPEHVYTTYRCHFTEMPIKALENLEFYKADESVELETVGYQCGKCQIAVSEEGRKKEGLGGKSPKGIAKAKCPKCSNKMGENLLQNIKEPEETEKAADS